MACFLLVHRAFHDPQCWNAVWEGLVAHEHTVLAPQLPGRGDIASRAAPVTLDAQVDVLGTDDRAIPPKLQRYVSDALGSDFLPIVGDHSPFCSAPEALVSAQLDADRRHR
jgi:hypothetical protein